jgi:acyl-ACP thioesterase
MFICLSTKKKFCNRRGKISLKRLADNVILRREPKNLEILRPAWAVLRMTITLFAEPVLSLSKGSE